MDSLLRAHLGPGLRERGFTGGPRTWMRIHPDRTDVIRVGAGLDFGTGRNGLHIFYGSRFAAANPELQADQEQEPGQSPASAKVWAQRLDLNLSEHGYPNDEHGNDPLSEQALAATSTRLREIVIPFLDSLCSYEAARAALEADIGVPAGAHQLANPDSFARWEVVGRIALGHQDKRTAEHYLQRALDLATAWLNDAESFRDWRAAEVTRLTVLLDQARQLP